ncbi:MAG: efflux transporter outer membrane subunit [Thermoanaerobaculia bacterium]
MTHRYRLFFVGVLFVSTAACVTSGGLGTAARPVDVTAWDTAAESAEPGATQDLSRWWEQLADPELTSLIDRALSDNPAARVAQARLRQARAQRSLVRADLVPSVTASGSASGRRTDTRVSGSDNAEAAQSSTVGSFGASIDASWEPDVFGGTRRGIDAATAEVAATAADMAATYVSLAAEVAVTYADLRTLQARLDIARRNEASQAETLELTGFRAQAGLVGSLDVEQARANVEQTRAQIPSFESGVAQATFRLATLTGAPAGALTASLSDPTPLPTLPTDVAIGIPADTLRQRPDVRSAEQRVIAETARLAQTNTQRYPRFGLSGSIGTETLTGVATGGASFVTSLAASVLQTLFDGGRIRQQIAIQSAVQEQAVANYEGVVLTALEDVESALVAFETSRQRLASLQAAADASASAALLAQSQYAAGLTDFQTVLSTERTLLSVQDSVALTQGDRVTALVQLYKALGGGWLQAPAALSGKASS